MFLGPTQIVSPPLIKKKKENSNKKTNKTIEIKDQKENRLTSTTCNCILFSSYLRQAGSCGGRALSRVFLYTGRELSVGANWKAGKGRAEVFKVRRKSAVADSEPQLVLDSFLTHLLMEDKKNSRQLKQNKKVQG